LRHQQQVERQNPMNEVAPPLNGPGRLGQDRDLDKKEGPSIPSSPH